MNNFEKILYEKINQDSLPLMTKQENDLFSFWIILKRQISERLSTVSAVFPHYSLHDSSHSEKILDIIWKMYGEDSLKNLSVSNIFAFLVSAYSHDLGMTITSSDLFSELNSGEFIELVKNLKDDENHPCCRYANCFEIKDGKLYHKPDLELNPDSYNAARFLLSVYFRNKHAMRSKEDIYPIFSNYGPYIKNAVITQIGNICLAHNQNFDEVLKLPKQENGIYSDSWNPLFIACSLRLGDLLDLESDRFSESYWESLPTRPLDSEFHRQKHEAIKHFVVNQDIIEATAECETYEVYKLLVDEFQSIKTEVSDQMSHWKQIAPNKDFPSLPCIGDFTISLNGFDTFENGKIPSFQINQKKAFELIQGAGIYENKYIAIREILQNSVDAIVIRCFLENEKQEENLQFEKFNEILSSQKIIFTLCKNYSKSDKNTICWTISIEDSGIGMDKGDIKFLLDATSSSQNPFKQEIISRMPEWTKPSGAFGLGFQSIFQISDRIKVETRKINSACEYELVLESPTNSIKSGVKLKTKTADYSKKSGTRVSFDFFVSAIPKKFGVSIEEPGINELIESFDFVVNQSLDYEISRIISAVQKFALTSVVPVEFNMEGEKPFIVKRNFENSQVIASTKFYNEYGLELIVPKNFANLKYCYRNSVISKGQFNIFFIPFSANIFSGNAKDILKYSRDEFQDNETVRNIFQNTIHAGKKYIIQNFDELPDDMKCLASMYVSYYDDYDAEIENANLLSAWESFHYPADDVTFKEIVDFQGIVKLQIARMGDYRNFFSVTKNNDEMVIQTQFNLPQEIHFLVKELLKSGKRVQLAEYGMNVIYEFTKSINENEKYDFIKDYEMLFANVITANSFFRRFTIPCNAKYSRLAVKSGKQFVPFEEVLRPIYRDIPKNYKIPVMVSPYVISRSNPVSRELKLENLNKVMEFTYENRRNSTVTQQEIEKLFNEFIEETQEAVKGVNARKLYF